VLNVFRMLGKMAGSRVAVVSSGGLSVEDVRDHSVRQQADVSALASRDERSAAVLIWNYHDDDLPGPPANVALSVDGLPGNRATLTEYRIDGDHSNAYSAWKALGSPQAPTAVQHAALERAGQLQTMRPESRVDVVNGRVEIRLSLPRQGVSLITLKW
jgi:xylan 1,4-beta-xylosidase